MCIKIKNFFTNKFKFKYVKACIICLMAFIFSTIIMFQCTQNTIVSSFWCSISTGLFTGFVFYIISGLKAYDENYYNDQNQAGIYCKAKTNQLCDNLERIIYKKDSVSYNLLQKIKFDLLECYCYYTGVVVANNKNNNTFKNKAEEFKSLYDEYSIKIGGKNSVNESRKLHKKFKEPLCEMYKKLYMMETDYSFICFDAILSLEQLKHNKF